MRFIFHFLGIIYFIIWIVIGAALLAGFFVFVKVKPWEMLKGFNLGVTSGLTGNVGNLGNLSNVSGAFSSVGNIAGVVQKLQSNKGDLAGAFNSLPKSEQDCLRKELGDRLVNDALAGKKVEPTPDLVIKAMKCVK